jgi:hypothetical protein
MLVIRNVFHCKPGKAKDLVQVFKNAATHMQATGAGNSRVMTDIAASFWTVIFETEAESLEAFEKQFALYGTKPEVQNAMKGYMDFVERGHREIWRIE